MFFTNYFPFGLFRTHLQTSPTCDPARSIYSGKETDTSC